MFTAVDGMLCLFIFNLIAGFAVAFGPREPQQIHLSYGVDPSTMVVVWTTDNSTAPAFAYYGNNDNWMTTAAVETKFVDIGEAKRTQYIYRAWMTRLRPGYKYVYRVGSTNSSVSDVYHFKAASNETKTFLIIGDLGYQNAQCLPRLKAEALTGNYDALFHIGDFAYDMATDESRVGDAFMNSVQPIAANLPYMTCPGNHEYAGNFSNYKYRFAMPNDAFGDMLYYSVDIGPIHLISINTEYLVFLEYGFWQILYQFQWLEEDLKKANSPEARAKHPWIITMGHRPMYCSNTNKNLCTYHFNFIRAGIPNYHYLSLENLFYEYGVDLAFWAHEHSYERLWPLYNYKVMNGSYSAPYTNPKAPVHIVTGAAGNVEGHDPFSKTSHKAWSAFRSTDYSYMRMKVYNHTHLNTDVVSNDQEGKVIDTMMIIKDHHGTYQL